MSLLAIATLAAATSSNRMTESPRCPSAATTAATIVASPAPAGREWNCPSLDISGQIRPDGLSLEPAFGSVVPISELSRNEAQGHATLQGFSGDGRTLFTFAFDATGPFSLNVPLDPATQGELRRVRLSAAGISVERAAAGGGPPDAEIVDVDEQHVLIIWDSTRFPGIRVRDARTGRLIGQGQGSSTYTQLTLVSTAREVNVEFSDGLHSTMQRFTVFGRS